MKDSSWELQERYLETVSQAPDKHPPRPCTCLDGEPPAQSKVGLPPTLAFSRGLFGI